MVSLVDSTSFKHLFLLSLGNCSSRAAKKQGASSHVALFTLPTAAKNGGKKWREKRQKLKQQLNVIALLMDEL
jgi:hypothetical protein